jgi:3-hydroxyacyl-CoA dehydrogenase
MDNLRDAVMGRPIEALLEFNQSCLDRACAGAVVRPLGRLGIVGGGSMGRAIAGRAIARGVSATVVDVDEPALARLRAALREDHGATGSPIAANVLAERLRTSTDPGVLRDCDVVVESVPEDWMLKERVYRRVEPHLAAGAVLATNTSTIPIARLARTLADPSRFCGIHFFPLREWSLVEIIRGPDTSAATLSAALGCAQALDMLPMLAPDGPGFVVNRLLLLYAGEAMQLLMEGASIEAVDEAAETFGMALGPLRLADAVGLDTTLDCGWSFCGAFPDTVPTSPLLVAMVKAKRLGRKSGGGFYRYEAMDGQPAAAHRDPAAEEIIARWAAPPRRHSAETITTRLFLAMVLEAVRMIESSAIDPRLIDLGVVRALGFPTSRGGLLCWADAVGAATVLNELRAFQSLGPRFAPGPLLLSLAREGRRFYDGCDS